MAKKYCYLFTEGNAKMREILGGKGANLAEMTNSGLPVPQGFTISTKDGKYLWDEVWRQGKSFARIRSFGRSRFHAWDDGHHS